VGFLLVGMLTVLFVFVLAGL